MSALAKIDDQQDKLMGEQLTAEFKEAVGGMIHVVRVGAMVMMLRQRVLSTVGETAPSRGPTAKGKGLDSWLEKYAPDVARGTAYRFEDVTKAVAKSFELPARVAKRLTFEQIVSADPKDLDDSARKVREQINGFVAGTSQKSWLDQFRETKERGGDTSGSRKKLTSEEEHKKFLEDSRNDFVGTINGVESLRESEHWKVPSIKDGELEAAADAMRELARDISAWLKIPRRDRQRDVASSSKNGSEQ